MIYKNGVFFDKKKMVFVNNPKVFYLFTQKEVLIFTENLIREKIIKYMKALRIGIE